jgi:hypothetical protein
MKKSTKSLKQETTMMMMITSEYTKTRTTVEYRRISSTQITTHTLSVLNQNQEEWND